VTASPSEAAIQLSQLYSPHQLTRHFRFYQKHPSVTSNWRNRTSSPPGPLRLNHTGRQWQQSPAADIEVSFSDEIKAFRECQMLAQDKCLEMYNFDDRACRKLAGAKRSLWVTCCRTWRARDGSSTFGSGRTTSLSKSIVFAISHEHRTSDRNLPWMVSQNDILNLRRPLHALTHPFEIKIERPTSLCFRSRKPRVS